MSPAPTDGSSNEADRLRIEIAELKAEFRAVSELGMRLSREMDLATLLPAIVLAARRFTRSEAGSLYVRQADELVFTVLQNDSFEPGPAGPPPLPKIHIAIDDKSLAGLAAAEARTLNIADAAAHPSLSRSAQDAFHYEVKTMLVTPLVDHHGHVKGVLQLMNGRGPDGVPAPYSERAASLCELLASHAATAMEIARLHGELTEVFDALVTYSTTAIDARDACTAGHSSRVANFAKLLAQEVGGFTDPELREIRFAGIFHDIGKIGVRECVLTKSTKLDSAELATVEARFSAAKEACCARAGALAGGFAADAAAAVAALEVELAFVREIVTPGRLDDAAAARLARLGEASYRDHAGQDVRLLQPEELEKLAVRQGNLTADERRQMEEHVTFSHRFLKKIPFQADLARVPEIAWSHHEKMDGSGYPRGLRGEQILLQARILAVVDVFDALTATDRPYKKATAPQRAVEIIERECELGAWDPSAVAALRRLVERGALTTRRQSAGEAGADSTAGDDLDFAVWRTGPAR